MQRHAWVDLEAKSASSEGRYSPSTVRRAVSADTGFVQISTLTQVINVWLGMWLEANMIHDLRHSDARERAKYGFAQGIEGLPPPVQPLNAAARRIAWSRWLGGALRAHSVTGIIVHLGFPAELGPILLDRASSKQPGLQSTKQIVNLSILAVGR